MGQSQCLKLKLQIRSKDKGQTNRKENKAMEQQIMDLMKSEKELSLRNSSQYLPRSQGQVISLLIEHSNQAVPGAGKYARHANERDRKGETRGNNDDKGKENPLISRGKLDEQESPKKAPVSRLKAPTQLNTNLLSVSPSPLKPKVTPTSKAQANLSPRNANEFDLKNQNQRTQLAKPTSVQKPLPKLKNEGSMGSDMKSGGSQPTFHDSEELQKPREAAKTKAPNVHKRFTSSVDSRNPADQEKSPSPNTRLADDEDDSASNLSQILHKVQRPGLQNTLKRKAAMVQHSVMSDSDCSEIDNLSALGSHLEFGGHSMGLAQKSTLTDSQLEAGASQPSANQNLLKSNMLQNFERQETLIEKVRRNSELTEDSDAGLEVTGEPEEEKKAEGPEEEEFVVVQKKLEIDVVSLDSQQISSSSRPLSQAPASQSSETSLENSAAELLLQKESSVDEEKEMQIDLLMVKKLGMHEEQRRRKKTPINDETPLQGVVNQIQEQNTNTRHSMTAFASKKQLTSSSGHDPSRMQRLGAPSTIALSSGSRTESIQIDIDEATCSSEQKELAKMLYNLYLESDLMQD